MLQVPSSSLLLFIVDSCVSYLLDQRSLILKLVLGCDRNLFSGTYPNQTYRFSSPAGLYKIVVRVMVFVISPVSINVFISFKAVPKILYQRFIYKPYRRLLHLLAQGAPSPIGLFIGNFLVYCWILIYKAHRRPLLL